MEIEFGESNNKRTYGALRDQSTESTKQENDLSRNEGSKRRFVEAVPRDQWDKTNETNIKSEAGL